LAKIIGQAGEQFGAVYKITVGREELAMKDHGAAINAPAFLPSLSVGLTGVAVGVLGVRLLGEMLQEHHG
jgi:hypothetical protein